MPTASEEKEQVVEIPLVGDVSFPSSMSMEEINTAAAQLYDDALSKQNSAESISAQQPAQPEEPTTAQPPASTEKMGAWKTAAAAFGSGALGGIGSTTHWATTLPPVNPNLILSGGYDWMLRHEARERDMLAGYNPELAAIDSELGEMERRGESPVGVGFTPQGTYPTGDDALMYVRATKKDGSSSLIKVPRGFEENLLKGGAYESISEDTTVGAAEDVYGEEWGALLKKRNQLIDWRSSQPIQVALEDLRINFDDPTSSWQPPDNRPFTKQIKEIESRMNKLVSNSGMLVADKAGNIAADGTDAAQVVKGRWASGTENYRRTSMLRAATSKSVSGMTAAREGLAAKIREFNWTKSSASTPDEGVSGWLHKTSTGLMKKAREEGTEKEVVLGLSNVDIGQGGGSLVPVVGIGLLTRNPTLALVGGAGVGGVQSAGGAYDEALEYYKKIGMPAHLAQKEAAEIAKISGAITFGVTTASGPILRRLLPDNVAKYVGEGAEGIHRGMIANAVGGLKTTGDTTLRQRAAELVKNIAGNIGQEALEEGTDTLLASAASMKYHEPDLKWGEALDRAAHAAKLGGLLGGSVQVTTQAAQALRERRERQAAELESKGAPATAEAVREGALDDSPEPDSSENIEDVNVQAELYDRTKHELKAGDAITVYSEGREHAVTVKSVGFDMADVTDDSEVEVITDNGATVAKVKVRDIQTYSEYKPDGSSAKDVPFEQPMITSPEVDGGIEFETEEGGIETGVVSKVDDNGLVTVSHSGGKGDSTVSPDKIRRLISKEQLEAARKQAEQQAEQQTQKPAPTPPEEPSGILQETELPNTGRRVVTRLNAEAYEGQKNRYLTEVVDSDGTVVSSLENSNETAAANAHATVYNTEAKLAQPPQNKRATDIESFTKAVGREPNESEGMLIAAGRLDEAIKSTKSGTPPPAKTEIRYMPADQKRQELASDGKVKKGGKVIRVRRPKVYDELAKGKPVTQKVLKKTPQAIAMLQEFGVIEEPVYSEDGKTVTLTPVMVTAEENQQLRETDPKLENKSNKTRRLKADEAAAIDTKIQEQLDGEIPEGGRLIPVSELKEGDTFRIAGERVTVVKGADGALAVQFITPMPSDPADGVRVGYSGHGSGTANQTVTKPIPAGAVAIPVDATTESDLVDPEVEAKVIDPANPEYNGVRFSGIPPTIRAQQLAQELSIALHTVAEQLGVDPSLFHFQGDSTIATFSAGGDGRINVNFNGLMDELSTLNNDEQAFRSFLSKAVEEEMIHNMDLLALRQEHKRQSESGQTSKNYAAWVEEQQAAMWDELTEQEQRTIWDTYTQNDTARTPFEKLTRSQKNKLAYEAVRQLVQQKATGEITESAVSKIFNRAMGKPESAWAKFINAIASFYESWSPAKGSKLEARANAAMELTGRAPVTTHAPSLDVAITKKRASELEALYSVFMEDNGLFIERHTNRGYFSGRNSPLMLKGGNAESLSQLAKRIREDFADGSGIESAKDGRTRRSMNGLADLLEKKAAELSTSRREERTLAKEGESARDTLALQAVINGVVYTEVGEDLNPNDMTSSQIKGAWAAYLENAADNDRAALGPNDGKGGRWAKYWDDRGLTREKVEESSYPQILKLVDSYFNLGKADSESEVDSDNIPFAPKLPSKEAAMGQLDLLFTDAELSQQAEEGAAIIADENKRQADERQKQEAELRNEYKDEIFEAPRSDVDELLTEEAKVDLYEYVINTISGGRGDFASVNRMVRNSKAAAMLPTAFLQEQAETFVYTRALNKLAKMAADRKLDLYDGGLWKEDKNRRPMFTQSNLVNNLIIDYIGWAQSKGRTELSPPLQPDNNLAELYRASKMEGKTVEEIEARDKAREELAKIRPQMDWIDEQVQGSGFTVGELLASDIMGQTIERSKKITALRERIISSMDKVADSYTDEDVKKYINVYLDAVLVKKPSQGGGKTSMTFEGTFVDESGQTQKRAPMTLDEARELHGLTKSQYAKLRKLHHDSIMDKFLAQMVKSQDVVFKYRLERMPDDLREAVVKRYYRRLRELGDIDSFNENLGAYQSLVGASKEAKRTVEAMGFSLRDVPTLERTYEEVVGDLHRTGYSQMETALRFDPEEEGSKLFKEQLEDLGIEMEFVPPQAPQTPKREDENQLLLGGEVSEHIEDKLVAQAIQDAHDRLVEQVMDFPAQAGSVRAPSFMPLTSALKNPREFLSDTWARIKRRFRIVVDPELWGVMPALKEMGLGKLADRVRDMYQYQREYRSLLMARVGDGDGFAGWVTRHSSDDIRDAKEQFAKYMSIREAGVTGKTDADRAVEANLNYEAAEEWLANNGTKATRELVEWVKAVSTETGKINLEHHVHVRTESGKWRLFNNLGERNWPRIWSARTWEIIRDPDNEANKAEFDRIVDHIVQQSGGRMSSDVVKEKLTDMWKTYNDGSGGSMNTHMANMETARGSFKLPDEYYDYSIDSYLDYIESYSTRIAQIRAFGQSRGSHVKDAWDSIMEDVADSATADRLKSIYQKILRKQNPDSWLQKLNKWGVPLAGAGFLSSPKTGARNVISGMFFNAEMFGTWPTLKHATVALWKSIILTGKSKKADYIMEAIRNGTLSSDQVMANELSQNSEGAQGLHKLYLGLVSKALIIQRTTEAYNRGVTTMLAEDFLNQLRHDIKADPLLKSSKVLSRLAKLKRMGFDGAKLDALLEGGDPVLKRDYLNAAVNEKQYSYNITQHPLWMDTPFARFLFQFHKWGYQRYRDFVRNTLLPMTGETVTVNGKEYQTVKARAFYEGMGNIALMVPNGWVYATLLRGLFDDKERKEEQYKDILISKEGWAQFLALADRAFRDALYSGGVGAVGDYLSFSIAPYFTRGARFKDPTPTPAVVDLVNQVVIGNLKTASDLILSAESVHDVKYIAEGMAEGIVFSMRKLPVLSQAETFVRYRALRAVGLDKRANALHDARKDVTMARAIARRYAEEAELDSFEPLDMPKYRATTKGVVFNNLHEALLIGDKDRARTIVKNYVGEADDPAKKVTRLAALKSSVQGRRPITVSGVERDTERLKFLSWAKKNAPTNYERIKNIERSYVKTAAELGLIK